MVLEGLFCACLVFSLFLFFWCCFVLHVDKMIEQAKCVFLRYYTEYIFLHRKFSSARVCVPPGPCYADSGWRNRGNWSSPCSGKPAANDMFVRPIPARRLCRSGGMWEGRGKRAGRYQVHKFRKSWIYHLTRYTHCKTCVIRTFLVKNDPGAEQIQGRLVYKPLSLLLLHDLLCRS